MRHFELQSNQRKHGVAGMQCKINTGEAFTHSTAIQVEASRLLAIGACVLPNKPTEAPDGFPIPSRHMVRRGDPGSWTLATKYYQSKLFNS